ncbi:hypothetical protein ABIB60_002772 [Hymenobacter sp. UYP22]
MYTFFQPAIYQAVHENKKAADPEGLAAFFQK